MSIPILFTGQGYRIISRAWAHDPVSGEGARRHGGRYNPRGMPAFYCSLDPQTAYAEYTVSLLDRPGWLCCFDIVGARLLDMAVDRHRAHAGLSEDDLSVAWKDNHDSPTQRVAQSLAANGIDGLIYASSRHEGGRNIVLWTTDQKPLVKLRDRFGETIIQPIPD